MKQAILFSGAHSEQRIVLVSCAALAVFYGLLAHTLSACRAFWSPDSGAVFGMIDNWVKHGSLIYFTYDNAPTDPLGRLHSLAGYLVKRPRGLCTVYPLCFPSSADWATAPSALLG